MAVGNAWQQGPACKIGASGAAEGQPVGDERWLWRLQIG